MAALLLVCYSHAFDLGIVKRMVTDPDGAAADGVLVHIVHWKFEAGTRKIVLEQRDVHTGEKGRYLIELQPGEYDIFFSSAMFRPIAIKTQVEKRKVIALSPRMKFGKQTKFIE